MTQDQLEQRLREKLPAVTPRPGFEPRIQALAREPYEPKRSSLLVRFALPAVALVALLLVFAPKDKPTQAPKVVEVSAPDTGSTALAVLKAPVTREYEGIKKDAQWTMSLFSSAIPSIPVSIMKERE